MTIEFLKDHNGWKKGRVLHDCMRNGALELIEQGIAKEVNPFQPPMPAKTAPKAKQAPPAEQPTEEPTEN